MAPVRGLRRHAGGGALLPLPSRRAPRSGAVAVGEEDPRVGCRLRVHRPPDEPADRTLSRERRPRPMRQGARQGGAEIRRQSGGGEDVPRLRLPAHAQRAVSQGLHPHRESGRGDRRARAPEQAPHRRVLPVEVQRRRGRVLPHRRVHGRMEDLADRSASELARLVRSREVSPVEVVEACLARVERYNPAVNAVVTLNPRALDDAGDLELRLVRGEEVGLLAGLPVGIKDVTPVAGLRTTYGSALYRDYIPAEDALVVRRLRDAGAVILGKTNCPEFAAGGNTFNEVFGRTRNPWDPTRSAGGSTGGGAAGLVTGMIALAEGTDLGGSLRIPASFCGVVGLRPSVGLVPTYPADWAWDTLQVEGPVARTAEDVALMLQAVAGPSPLSPLAQPTAPMSPGSGSTRPSSRCAVAPPSGSASSASKSTKSSSICRSVGGHSSRCAGCGSSRRCFHGWTSWTGSEPTWQVTFGPGSTRPHATSAPRKRRAAGCGTCSTSSSGSSTTWSRRAWRFRPLPWTRTIPRPWPARKWRRTWIGSRPPSC